MRLGTVQPRPHQALWGLVSGYPDRVRRERLLGMFQVYADDSKEPPVFVMGGLISTLDRWLSFSDEWQRALDINPRIKYFKAQEAWAIKKEFEGFTKSQRDQRLTALAEIINNHVMYGRFCVIDLDAYYKVFTGKMSKPMNSPYYHCANRLLYMMIMGQYSRAIPGKVDFIFDEQGKEFDPIISAWRGWNRSDSPSRIRRRLGSPPRPASDHDVLPLQAADYVAWGMHRSFFDQQGKEYKGHMFSLGAMMTIGQITVPLDFEYWGEDRLRSSLRNMQEMNGGNFKYEAAFRPNRRQRNRAAKHRSENSTEKKS